MSGRSLRLVFSKFICRQWNIKLSLQLWNTFPFGNVLYGLDKRLFFNSITFIVGPVPIVFGTKEETF